MSQAQELPAVSVVVIGRNEGARLIRCLESVRAMRSPGGQVELIYVDSASTDGSPERAAACGAKVLVVRPERPCAAVGRNAGWQAAAAPFVLFLDGDTLLHPDFVADCLPQFTLPQVAVVWGHRRELHPQASIYNRILDLDWVYPPGLSEFCGGDALIRHSVLQEVGGYDERLIAGKEPEMCRRMRDKGYVILHVDRPMTGHDLAMTRWSQYWRRAVRAGYAYAEVAQRFRGTGTPLWQHEVQRNRIRGAVLVGCPMLVLVCSLALTSALPLVVLLGVSAGIIVRKAAKARWKSSDRWTLLLYSLHSHVQQVPIFFGQLCYGYDRWRGRRRGLIEYKGDGPLSRLAKQLTLTFLSPWAALAGLVLDPFRRTWAHARLGAKIHTRIDPSVVILDVPEVHGTARISLGKSLYLYRELYLETQEDGVISIGDDVVISRGTHIVAFAKIAIGDGTMIGQYTSIRDANHRIGTGGPIRTSGHDALPIYVGRNVWIGRGVTILPGVTIDDGAVIGANAVVTHNVPKDTIVVGVPAKPLAERRIE